MQIIEASADTVHWGYLGAALRPVATVASGDTVRIHTVSGPPEVVEGAPHPALSSLLDVHARTTKRTIPGHICTGPIRIVGARPGQVLQVDIRAIDLACDWGYAGVRPLAGALPHDFDGRRMTYVEIDRAARIARLPWGMDLPLAPFFGVIATAPPPAWGELSTIPPRRNGGNMDNKELVAGTTLYLPVFVEGALFSVGDGHAAQGDGEICTQAVETSLDGTFTLTLRDDMALDWPMAETPSHLITMGFDPDLDDCVVIVVRRMIDLLVAHCGLDRYEAYTLLSFAGDLRITQVVNGSKGVHLMLDKRYARGLSLRTG